MKTVSHVLLLAALFFTTQAQARVFASVGAADVAVVEVQLDPLTQYEWHAEVTAGNADLVLHIVQSGKDLYRAFSPGQTSATLQFFSLFGGPATLVVRSVSGTGQINLTQRKGLGRRIRLLSAESIAGGSINVDGLNGPGEFFETAHAPGGIANPALIGLDAPGQDGRIVAYDQDSGIGNNAVISHIAIRELVMFQEEPDGVCIFGEPCAGPGIGSVYVNDRYSDTDNDGLGDELEIALDTCPGHTVSTCAVAPGSAKLVANTRDSDADGLTDYEELFGADDVIAPQYLSRWGADPRHKDVFVEVDRRDTGNPAAIDPANTFSDSELSYVTGSFLLGSSASDLENPDGLAGINVHLDIGIDPTQQQLDSIPGALTLFGDWGGSEVVPPGVGTVESGQNYMATVRQKLFRHALLVEGESSTGKAAGRYLFWNGNPKHFAHELGHTLGLEHQGSPSMPNVNCKPHHISIMNYQYGWIPGVTTFDPSRFSDGSRTVTLNPAQVFEPDGIGIVDPRFYNGNSLPTQSNNLFPQIKDLNDGSVDWDFSGDFSGRNIRAPLTFVSSQVCGTSWKNPQSVAQSTQLPAATPALARSDSHLFAFWVQSNGRVGYSHSTVGGPDAKGSCPLSDHFETECAAWSTPKDLGNIANATTVDAVALNGSVHVLTRASNGILSIASFSVSNGELGRHQTLNLGERAAGEPEIAGIYFRTPRAKAEVAIGVWYVGAFRQLRQIVLRDNGRLSVALGPQPTVMSGQPNVMPIFAPSVEAWPDIANPVASIGRNCMALPGPDNVEMFCDKFGDNNFVHKQSLPLRDTLSKPGLEFRVHRRDSGTALDGVGRKGNFWLAYVRSEGGAERTKVAISQPFDGSDELTFSSAGSNSIDWHFNFGGRQRVLSGSGVMLYMDDDTSALKGIAVQGPGALTTTNGVGQTNIAGNSSVTFLPFADGTFRVDMLDNNDWVTMANEMCRKLRGETFCSPN